MAKFAYDDAQGQEGRDPQGHAAATTRSGLTDVVHEDFTELGGTDRRTPVSYSQGDADFRAQLTQVKQREARRDLRARLLHRGRPSSRARRASSASRAAPRRRRLGLGDAARDRRRGARTAATSRTTTRPTTRLRSSRSSSTSYKAKFGEMPDAIAALGYDAAKVLADAIEARRVDRRRRRCATRSPPTKDFPGVTGAHHASTPSATPMKPAVDPEGRRRQGVSLRRRSSP